MKRGGMLLTDNTVDRIRSYQQGLNPPISYAFDEMIPSMIIENEQLVVVPLTKLKFQSNNRFNLFNAILELDETIAGILSPLTLMSYGGVQWGIKPFISDLKSLLNSFKDLYKDSISDQLSTRRVVYSTTSSLDYTDGVGRKITVQLSSQVMGTISYSTPDNSSAMLAAIQIFLDELGAHPDINTIWDAIPLSFLVDYFIPVSDILSELHPQRGWYNPTIHFSGGFVHKAVVISDIDVAGRQISSKTRCVSQAPGVVHYFARSNPLPLTITPVSDGIEWSAPNSEQVANTAYLATNKVRRQAAKKIGYKRPISKPIARGIRQLLS